MMADRRRMPLRLIALCAVSIAASARASEPPAAKDHPILPPQEALATFSLPPGFRIEVVAAEPTLFNPMTMALDEQGHVYVSLAHTYRYGKEGSPVGNPSNPIVRLEPNADGSGFHAVEVASGFADPIMGLAVRGGELWATNLNQVFAAPLGDDGKAGERRTVVRDAETPWNPFGMYRITERPDGLFYLCVGDHPTKLSGSADPVAVRGSTGAVFRFRADGSDIEILAQGMRAPFSFDIDPYGRIWILSNGEGNPNRLIHAIPGADYHFQTRSVDWEWLAGRHPWAPPVYENPPGAHTTVLVYDSSAFPAEYWGNLLVANWGVHGFPSANHVILRHVVDERGNRLETTPFLTTTDPRFRPTQIARAPDGNLFVLDWYGMDDENDLTGRLYKISYTGDANTGTARSADAASDPVPPAAREGDLETALAGLANRNHWVRDASRRVLRNAGAANADSVGRVAAEGRSLEAAEALWVLRAGEWSESVKQIERAFTHADWRVRRLAVQLRSELPDAGGAAARLLDDPDPDVRMEASLNAANETDRLSAVIAALRAGAARDARLRYRGALAIARGGSAVHFEQLLADTNQDVRTCGLIALDEAFHEGLRADAASEALAKRIEEPGAVKLDRLLAVADQWPRTAWEGPVATAMRGELSASELVQCVAILRKLKPASATAAWDGELDRFWTRAAAGEVAVTTAADKQGVLSILALDRVQPNTLAVLDPILRDSDVEIRDEAHRTFAAMSGETGPRADLCRRLIRDTTASLECRLDAIVSLASLESDFDETLWTELLDSTTREVSLVALRSLRNHGRIDAAAKRIASARERLSARGPEFQGALDVRERAADLQPGSQQFLAQLYAREKDRAAVERKERLRTKLLEGHAQGNAGLGRLVFRAQVCSRCHRSGGPAEFAGPPLDGIAATQPVEYLVDSILYPSKTIKTGFMLELVVTTDGRVLVGGAVREGDALVVTSPTGTADRVAMDQIEQRRQLNRSLMPESLESTMSEAELFDLVAYLASLRTPRGAPGPSPR
ncbi:MAG: c-type cytochrome [Planctomycetes bacterium]|nr:c-type cytochrome [Planctomycetota bacterium]